tara:strand:- start:257 stop:517 length:261 start_codon:yes stop_codon:yes gene_type:complete
MFDIQKMTKEFVERLNEGDTPQWRSYLQSIDEALSSVKIRTQRDARKVELARHNLVEIRRHLKRMDERVTTLEEKLQVLEEKKGKK